MKFGWRRDIPDHRDIKFLQSFRLKKKLPPLVDMRDTCSPIEDQLDLGSCTAQALVGNLEFLVKKNKKRFKDFSRLFLYYCERDLEGSVDYDAGAMIRDGIKALKKWGCCLEKTWPYIPHQFDERPPLFCYIRAKAYQITSYYRLTSLDEIKSCLADGFPVVFGFSVYDSCFHDDVAKTGVVPLPARDEKLQGGHAVMACGYNDRLNAILFRNSWGVGWGEKGYGLLPYPYFENEYLSADYWTIRAGEKM